MKHPKNGYSKNIFSCELLKTFGIRIILVIFMRAGSLGELTLNSMNPGRLHLHLPVDLTLILLVLSRLLDGRWKLLCHFGRLEEVR